MMPQHSINRVHKIFGERVRSLLEDGYCCRVKRESDTLLYARLKHMSNGNEIRIYGHPLSGGVEQYTNNILTFIHSE